MKAKQIFEFTRGDDPLDTLGIGYKAKIYKFFDDLGVHRNNYTIEGKQIKIIDNLSFYNCTSLTKLPDNLKIFGYLNLRNCINLVKLPDNLYIGGWLNLFGCISLVKLPENLLISSWLNLKGCYNLLELPDNLTVRNKILVSPDQPELIKCILHSKFKKQLLYE